MFVSLIVLLFGVEGTENEAVQPAGESLLAASIALLHRIGRPKVLTSSLLNIGVLKPLFDETICRKHKFILRSIFKATRPLVDKSEGNGLKFVCLDRF